MAAETELIERIEACRTCGIFFLTSSNFLRQIFAPAINDPEMMLIRMELNAWNVTINENDGFPQNICTCCINEFQKLFKFRRSCVDMQQQWHHFYNMQLENTIHIKKELPDVSEAENVCDFIYVDDISDDEGKGGGVTPFIIPHLPIKDELIEAAAVPQETPTTSIDSAAVAASRVVVPETEHNIVKEILQPPLSPAVMPLEQVQPTVNTFILPTSDTTDSIQCSFCQHTSATQLKHRIHMRRMHEVKDFECHICGKHFNNAVRLKFHVKWHKSSRNIRCFQCGLYCETRDTLTEHMHTMHSKTKCNICKKYVILKKIAAHMHAHAGTSEWACTDCSNVFQSKNEHDEHFSLMHNSEHNLPKYKENQKVEPVESFNLVCEQEFPSQNDHELQVIHHHPATNTVKIKETSQEDNCVYVSDEDNKIFSKSNFCNNESAIAEDNPLKSCTNDSSSSELDEDEEDDDEGQSNETEVETELPQLPPDVMEMHQFVCAQCTETFATVEKLIKHHQQHKKKPEFSCHICSKSFDLKFSLNRHIKKHKKAPF